MKKTLLLALTALCAYGAANAATTITFTNVEQPVNDTLLYAMPESLDHFQDIQNYPIGKPEQIVMKFQPEYLVTPAEFSVGDTNKGTPTLPNNAKVIGVGLNGYDVASEPDDKGLFQEVTAWCYNTEKTALDGVQLFDGYNKYPAQGELYTDTINYRNPWQNTPGYLCYFDEDADSLNPGTIIDIPFNNPNADPASFMADGEDTRFPPFWYQGKNIILTLWVNNFQWVNLKYRYMTYDNATTQIASLMRTGNLCFNTDTYETLVSELGVSYVNELPYNRLPAFRLPYYTNDIRVVVNNSDDVEAAEVVIYDEDGNKLTPAEDGNYYNVDHTKTYTVVVDDDMENAEVVDFTNIYKDIVVNVTKDRTAVEEVNATRTVASTRYFNVAGQEMTQPTGMTIVVTTYTDGTSTTSKVIK